METWFSCLLNFLFPLVSLSAALCHFSDGILEYLANLDKAPDPTVRKDTFSSEIFAAFDILFNNWLQSRESKVRSVEVNVGGSTCSGRNERRSRAEATKADFLVSLGS